MAIPGGEMFDILCVIASAICLPIGLIAGFCIYFLADSEYNFYGIVFMMIGFVALLTLISYTIQCIRKERHQKKYINYNTSPIMRI